METQIPGIYNYCDRWCERCAQSGRCAVFSASSSLPEIEPLGAGSEFWKKLSGQFESIRTDWQSAARKWGIEMEEPDVSELMSWKRQLNEEEAQLGKHPLIREADLYAKEVGKLIADESFWRNKMKQLAKDAAMGILSAEKGRETARLLDDCGSVIRWYQYFIALKFRRGFSGQQEDRAEGHTQQRDCDGSAKVALLGVDRSRLALGIVFSVIPDEDRLLPLLARLERIEKMGNEQFPLAEGFVRPGFDDE